MSSTVTIAGRALAAPRRHVCCFFDSRDQQYDVLLPYFAEAVANGEKAMAVMPQAHFDDHDRRLRAAGIDVEATRRSGQVLSLSSEATYLADGSFSKQRMHRLVEVELQATATSPFRRLRTCGDMSWLIRAMPMIQDVLAYESEVNALLDRFDAAFLCVYDVNQLSGRDLLDVLATHSHVLIGRRLHDNPQYLTPDEYREQVLRRRSAATETMAAAEPPR